MSEPEETPPPAPRLSWGTRLTLVLGLLAGPVYLAWVAGIEGRLSTAAIPFLTLPAAELTGGVGYSIDRPYKGRTTLHVDVTYRP